MCAIRALGVVGTVLKMFVLRYFGYVGGALLALLFACNAVLPKQPLPDVVKSGSEVPAIRIQSERKWPERVVFDTTMVPIAAPAPAPVTITKTDTPPVVAPQAQATPVTAKARVREAFAQFTPAEPKAGAVKTQPKRKLAKARLPHPMMVGRPVMLAAQQPHFGFFENTW